MLIALLIRTLKKWIPDKVKAALEFVLQAVYVDMEGELMNEWMKLVNDILGLKVSVIDKIT